ncbi:MAG TPA: prephenate dehydrogenase [Vicinamibacterales bacterium]|jgi:prephenate dehydrogenase|nr:prephenate dehydrogenase [Vicinamibacterales bacterium]
MTNADAPFRRIGIVGFGLIGGSIALAARRRWPKIKIVAVDHGAVARHAAEAGLTDRAGEHLELLNDADLVVLAAPVLASIKFLPLLPPVLRADALVTDVASTKRAIVAAAEAAPVPFIGGHPIAGAVHSGCRYARADLFDGHSWILTPRADHAPQLERLEWFVRGLGSTPHVMTPDLHDRYLAIISHLPQFASSALMHVVGKTGGDMALELAGPGLADSTRLASSPPGIWRDIAATNEDALRGALDELIRALEHLRDGLSDGAVIESTFASARRWREALLRARGEQ